MKKQIREITERKEQNERLIKDRLIRDFRTLFEQDEGYYKPERVSNFWSSNYINVKVMVIKIETYHLMNISIKLNLT